MHEDMYLHIFTYTSSYVGLMPTCHVWSAKSFMSYENPEYQCQNTRPAGHRPRVREASRMIYAVVWLRGYKKHIMRRPHECAGVLKHAALVISVVR